jgi:thymidylate kinase
MDFYFENKILKLNPYLIIFIKILKDVFLFLTFIFSFWLIFFKEAGKLRLLPLFLCLMIIIFYFISQSSKKRIPFLYKGKFNLSEYLTYSCLFFFIESLARFKILKIKNFYIFLFIRFLKEKKIQKLFLNMDVCYSDLLKEASLIKEPDYRDYLPILVSAFKIAKRVKYPRIDIYFLFCGLVYSGGLEIGKILDKFDIKKEEILATCLKAAFSKEIYVFKIRWFLNRFFLRLDYLRFFLPLWFFLDKKRRSNFLRFIWNSFSFLNLPLDKNDLSFLSYNSFSVKNLFKFLVRKENVLLISQEQNLQDYPIYQVLWILNNYMVEKEFYNYKILNVNLEYILLNYSSEMDYILQSFFSKISKKPNIFFYFSIKKEIFLKNKSEIASCFEKLFLFLRSPLIISFSTSNYSKLKKFEHFLVNFNKIKISQFKLQDLFYFLIFKDLSTQRKQKIFFQLESLFLIFNFSKDFLRLSQFIKFNNNLFKEIVYLAKKNKINYINKEFVSEILASKLNLSLKKRISLEKEKALSFKKLLSNQIVNQKEALEEIVFKLRKFFIKNSPRIGFYLFIGPKGVGKTEVVKSLANIFYGGQKNVLFLDMKEYGSKPINDKVVNFIKINNSSLIFIKNIELSDLNFWHCIKNFLEENCLNDDFGRKIDLSNFLVICSTSLFSSYIKDCFDRNLTKDFIKNEIKNKISSFLPDWVINRFDDIIIFKSLENKDLREILEKKLDNLSIDIFLRYGVVFEFSERVKNEILKSSFNSIWGAKTMVDKINFEIKPMILEFILKENLKRGQKIYIDFDKKLKFQIIS